ncbi:hypothetical protein AaE_010071, partial [Aphanomyces astaci]
MENYNIYDEIGRGQHSYVYKARRKRSIEYMAVKSTAKDRMNKILNEVQFLRTFSSPYVLKFHNWYESSNHIWIIFEFCIGGDLLNLITQDKMLPESTIKSFGYDMLMGLQYLHSNGVIYCDLKPANVLIDEYGGLKLSDLGLARKIPTDESVLKVDKLAPGSPHYMAPELFEQHPVHSFASDFWALVRVCPVRAAHGVPAVLERRGVYGSEKHGPSVLDYVSIYGIQTKAVAIPPPAHVDMSRDLCDLLHRLLVKDPAQRISWCYPTLSRDDDILGHPFWDKTSHKTSSSPLPTFPPQPLFMKRYPTLPQSNPICDKDQSPHVSQHSNSTCSNDDGGDSMIRTRPATAPPLVHQPDLPPPNNDGLGTSARHPDRKQQLSPLPPPKTAPPPHRNLARPHQPVKLSTPKPAPHRIFTTLDGAVQPIVACADIEAVAVPRINDTLVPFAVVPVASLATQADIEAKLEQLYHYLRRNDVTVSDKHNALAYLFSISTSSKVANIIVNSSLMTLLGKLLEQSTSSALSSRLGLVLGYVVRYATFIAPDVVVSLAPILVQAMDVENVQITRRVVACMGELAFYSVTQHQPLSCALVQSLVRALQADDVIVRHYAVQTVGNILTHSSDDSDVGVVDPFITPAVALALIEKSLRVASPPNLQMAAMLTLSQVLKHTLSQ